MLLHFPKLEMLLFGCYRAFLGQDRKRSWFVMRVLSQIRSPNYDDEPTYTVLRHYMMSVYDGNWYCILT